MLLALLKTRLKKEAAKKKGVFGGSTSPSPASNVAASDEARTCSLRHAHARSFASKCNYIEILNRLNALRELCMLATFEGRGGSGVFDSFLDHLGFLTSESVREAQQMRQQQEGQKDKHRSVECIGEFYRPADVSLLANRLQIFYTCFTPVYNILQPCWLQ